MIATAPRRPSLARVVTQGKALPDRIVLYAPPGWGKTTFATGFPRPIFLMTPGEDRLVRLIEQGLVPQTAHFQDLATSFLDVRAAVRDLIDLEHDHQTLVIDAATGAERLAHEQIAIQHFSRDDGEADWGEHGFNGFGKGEKISANQLWMPFLQLLDDLRATRRMRIVLLCHSGTHSQRNPDGPDYDKVAPLSKQAWAFTSKWADMILRGSVEVTLKKDDPKSKIAKAKAQGGNVRILHTVGAAAFDAKNCHRLPPTIRLGEDPHRAFDAFRAAFPKRQEVSNGHGTTHDLNGTGPRTLATVGATTAAPPDAQPASDP
ncbi:MAG TPA: hypothetical protein DDY78_29165 [Planctomycetales bacterium]|jgi:hypothetical protein|nr:hypothetical protein [Planctomycetales bacterium]